MKVTRLTLKFASLTKYNMKHTINVKKSFINLLALYVHFCQSQLLFTSEQPLWLSTILTVVEKNGLDPYHVNIFIDDFSTISTLQGENFIRNLSQKIPILSVLIQRLHSNQTSTTFEQLYKYVHALIIILLHQESYDTGYGNVKYALDFYDNLKPTSPRPHCLLINIEPKTGSKYNYKSILEYAWSKKFFDFDVLEVDSDNEYLVYSFNFFYKKVSEQVLDTNVQLFPNKLNDANGHKFKVAIFHYPPYMNVVKTGREYSMNKTYRYGLLLFAIRTLNFSVSPVINPKVNITLKEAFGTSLKQLENSEANVIALQSVITGNMKNLSYSVRKEGCVKYLAFVPILPNMKWNLSWRILIYILTIPLIFLLLNLLMYFIKFHYVRFDLFDVFQVFFGYPLALRSNCSMPKIMFIFIAFVPIIFSTDYVSNLMKIRTAYDELAFDTLKEIYESNFSIYTDVTTGSVVFDRSNNSYIRNMRNRLILFEKRSCYDVLKENKHAICVLSGIRAEYELEDNKKFNKTLVKIAKPKFACITGGYLFEKASPYVKRFDEVFQRMAESGLMKKLIEMKYIPDDRDEERRKKIIDDIYLSNLIIMLMNGYGSALALFLCELIVSYINKKYSVKGHLLLSHLKNNLSTIFSHFLTNLWKRLKNARKMAEKLFRK